MKLNQKNKFIFSIFFVVTANMMFFQNCARQKFDYAADPQNAALDKVTGEPRMVDIDLSKTKVETTSKNLKILLVIDNSATMANSQENLSRNLNILLSSLKGKNANVMIIPTDAYLKDTALTQSISALDPLTNTNYQRGLQRALTKTGKERPIFSFNKDDSADQFGDHLSSLSSAIKSLGTSGSANEAPLASLALNLNYQQFFNKNDTALIYFITDENDTTSFNANYYISSQYYKTEVQNYTSMSVYCINCYRFEYKYSSSGPSADGTKQTTVSITNRALYANASECANAEKEHKSQGSIIASSCKFYGTFTPDTGAGLMAQNISCADYLSSYPLTKSSEIICKSETSSSNVSVAGATYQFYDLKNTGKHVTVTFNNQETLPIPELTYKIMTSIKNQMEQMFNGNYIIGASVNTKTQNCVLKAGQSMDQNFTLMQKFFPEGKFIVDSICDSTKFTSHLEEISKKFEEITQSSGYPLEINSNLEQVSEITLTQRNGNKIILHGHQYTLSNNLLSFINIDLDAMDVIKAEVHIAPKH